MIMRLLGDWKLRAGAYMSRNEIKRRMDETMKADGCTCLCCTYIFYTDLSSFPKLLSFSLLTAAWTLCDRKQADSATDFQQTLLSLALSSARCCQLSLRAHGSVQCF